MLLFQTILWYGVATILSYSFIPHLMIFQLSGIWHFNINVYKYFVLNLVLSPYETQCWTKFQNTIAKGL